MEPFDLIDYQQKARETCDPKKLFELWEEVSRRYERREIGNYELEEMKGVIWPSLTQLAVLRRMVNGQVLRRKTNIGASSSRRKTG